MAANRPLMEPPMTRARRRVDFLLFAKLPFSRAAKLLYHRDRGISPEETNAMALTMLDKTPVDAKTTAWPPEIAAEFERESKNPNGCVGQRLLSESERVRVWEIRLKPGQRFGFH